MAYQVVMKNQEMGVADFHLSKVLREDCSHINKNPNMWIKKLQNISFVTAVELIEICNKFGDRKSPTLNSIPNNAPKMFDMYNSCLNEGVFREQLKQQRKQATRRALAISPTIYARYDRQNSKTCHL